MYFTIKNKPVSAGDMRNRISVLQQTSTGDGMGGSTATESELCKAWAAIEPLKGMEITKADQLQIDVVYSFVIRYRNDIKQGMIVSLNNQRYRIAAIFDQDNRHRLIQLQCVEVTS